MSEALDRLTAAGVAVARVLSRYDVFTDPWLRENEMFHSIPDPQVGAYYGIRGYTDWAGTAGVAPPGRSRSARTPPMCWPVSELYDADRE